MGNVVQFSAARRRRPAPPSTKHQVELRDVDAAIAKVEAEQVATRDKVFRLDTRSEAYVEAFQDLIDLRDTWVALNAIRDRLVKPPHLAVVRG